MARLRAVLIRGHQLSCMAVDNICPGMDVTSTWPCSANPHPLFPMSMEELNSSCQLKIQGNSHVQFSPFPIAAVLPAKKHNPNSAVIYTCYFMVRQYLSKFCISWYFVSIFTNFSSSCMHPEISTNFPKNSLPPKNSLSRYQLLQRRTRSSLQKKILGKTAAATIFYPVWGYIYPFLKVSSTTK